MMPINAEYPMAGAGGFIGPMQGSFPAAPSPASAGQAAFRGAGQGGNPFTAAARPQSSRPPAFGPDVGGIIGLIGRLTGAPTRAEWAAEQAGGARARGVATLQGLMAQGKNPQEALLEFVATPAGQEMLEKDPDALRQAVTAASAFAPPVPEAYTLGAGEARFEGPNKIASNAPMDVQEFNAFAEISALPDEAIQLLASAKLADAATGEKTQAERAWARIVQAGLASQETADASLAGAVEIVDIKDAAGNTKGKGIHDRRDGSITPIGNGGMATAPQPGDPEFAPGLDDPQLPERGASEVPADIIFGAGIAPWIKETAGGVLGQEFPELSGRDAAMRRGYLHRIRADMQNYREVIGEDRSFARDAELVDKLGNFTGFGVDAGQTFDGLMQLHEFIDRGIERDMLILNDPTKTADVIQNADSRIVALERIRTSLPSVESLKAIEPQIAGHKAWSDGWADAKEGEQVIEDELGGGQKPAPNQPRAQEFGTMEDLQSAFEAGTVTFGDRVVVGGKAFRLKQPSGNTAAAPLTQGKPAQVQSAPRARATNTPGRDGTGR